MRPSPTILFALSLLLACEADPEDECPGMYSEECGCAQEFFESGCECSCGGETVTVISDDEEFPASGVCADLDGTVCGATDELTRTGCVDYDSEFCGP